MRNRKLTTLGLVAAVAAVLCVQALVQRAAGPAKHEAKGTILSIDTANRRAVLEVIDPANGATRQFHGAIAENCAITINGMPATLADLRVGDVAQVRARSERGPSVSDRDQRSLIVAEFVHVTRRENANVQ